MGFKSLVQLVHTQNANLFAVTQSCSQLESFVSAFASVLMFNFEITHQVLVGFFSAFRGKKAQNKTQIKRLKFRFFLRSQNLVQVYQVQKS